jgi:uncharacterized protein
VTEIYHDGNRYFQDEFDSRRLADRLVDVIVHDELEERDRKFIESRDLFFISTVDDSGRPTVSYKGGTVGFVHVVDKKTIAFPGYDGNGMFLTAGNIAKNKDVGLLFVDFENPLRIRLHGTATVHTDDPLLSEFKEAQYIVRISVRNLFVNCPRYVHKFKRVNSSEFVPREGCTTPEPEWKSTAEFEDVLPKNRR